MFVPGVTYQMINTPADAWPENQLDIIRRLIAYEYKSQALSRGEIGPGPGQAADLPAGKAEPAAARNKAAIIILGAAALFFILRR